MNTHEMRIYRCDGEWCYALWIDGEYDSSDTLDVSDDATEAEVRAHINDNYTVQDSVRRVPDVDRDGNELK